MLQFAKLHLIFPNRKNAKPEERRSKLGFFTVSPETGNVIEEIQTNPSRSISKVGRGYVYSISATMGILDTRHAEIAKESLISALSEGNSVIPSMDIAQAMAKSRLLEIAPPDMADPLSYFVAHDTVGYGPISILMEDKRNIEEIEINSPCSNIVVYSPRYGRCQTNLRFSNEHSFRNAINRMIRDTEKELNENTPIIDAQVDDLRIHAQIKPYALSGAAASIRVGGRKEITLDYLIKSGTASPEMLAYLWIAIETRQNMIVSGAPASGKTTLLSALTAFIPSNEKVITVEEDVNEIRSTGTYNVVGLYGSRYNSVSPKEQVINSLRMRPNRIIVGEMRGEEAKDLFSGGNMGISFAATMHSNEGGEQILKKLMIKPMGVETRSLSMLDMAVYMKQADISRRVISGIFEYRWLSRAETEDGMEINGEDMVRIDCMMSSSRMDRGSLRESKVMESYSRHHEISSKEAILEFERRVKLIEKCSSGTKECRIEDEIVRYSGW